MKMRRYSLFSGKVVDRRRETCGKSPHFQILLEGGGQRFRVAVNTRSGTSHSRESDLLYCSDHEFRHEVTRHLARIADGHHFISSQSGGLALDYQRGGIVDRHSMRRIPSSRPGPDNDLVDELDFHIDCLLSDSSNRLHAYGTRWGPEPRTADQVFEFSPGNGIHDVHMNQGNRDEHWHDNGIWSDGGLIFQVSSQNRWSAIFLAFQTQSWNTNNNGDPVQYLPRDGRESESDRGKDRPAVRIVGAFVHPNEQKIGVEHIAIRNDTGGLLDLDGLRARNRNGDEMTLHGVLAPRAVQRFELPEEMQLSSRGGLISLLDENGKEIDRVSYTRHQVRRRHGSLTF